ncbi:biotin--[acetyl-CoA-carboxylase] ligase [Extensimonas perlucida]|uniref:biotin--[acetyl-CoA-carboxylase] ligase n=1 Tax=Extensimonas perlucida TaxID=2590786 RepID=UPI00119E875C|nr:biotin--[acetyl-CoA-carboxylase] ligase [Extensimonas perlucida]
MTQTPLHAATDAASADRPVWPIAALQQALTAHLPGGIVEVLERIDSTNTELMRRARDGHCVPTLLVAEQQTAGRGRLGRQWLSSPGDSLTFSLGLPLAPRDWSGLSLAVGLSVAESLQPELGALDRKLRLGLKWPNDLWLADDRKLGGILIETASFVLPDAAPGFAAQPRTSASASARYVVIGIGINIRPRDAQGLATPPACLQDIAPGACQALGVDSENAPQRDPFLPDSQPTTPKSDRLQGMDAPSALLRLLGPLLATVQAFAAHGFAPLRARYAARDLLAGREVLLSDGTSGVAQGVGADGALQVQTPTGLRSVTSSEVSVRPRARAVGAAGAGAADDSGAVGAATSGPPAAPSSAAK